MLTLGINYGSHDSAAAIARDGEILFATAEERLSRKKHDSGFPLLAIRACLAHAGVELGYRRGNFRVATLLRRSLRRHA